MKFDVIICTLNRPDRLRHLLSQIFQCRTLPSQVIVVDASLSDNDSLRSASNIRYIRSSHQNQPYQRYVGYLVSDAEIVVFMDDDLEIVDRRIFDQIIETYNVYQPNGVSVGIKYENSTNQKLNNTVNPNSYFFKWVNFLSGVPILKPGRIYPAGLAGPDLKMIGEVDFFHGPFMSFKRSILKDMYDPYLYSLYEVKMGKGEDKVLSMRIGLSKKLIYIPEIYLNHPPAESHYFSSTKDFFKRLSYSRLYLSQVYSEAKKTPYWLLYIHYIYFMTWRISIALFRFIFKREKTQSEIIAGVIAGSWLAVKKSDRVDTCDWQSHAFEDAKGDH